jgi:hypothetical protein
VTGGAERRLPHPFGRLWVPLSVDYYEDQRILRAGAPAELLFYRSLQASKRNQTDGFVPTGWLRALACWPRSASTGRVEAQAKALLANGLWEYAAGGYFISDWFQFNQFAEEVTARREAQRRAAMRTNHGRWHEDKKDPDCEFCQADQVSMSRSLDSSPNRSVDRSVAVAQSQEQSESEGQAEDPSRSRRSRESLGPRGSEREGEQRPGGSSRPTSDGSPPIPIAEAIPRLRAALEAARKPGRTGG